MKGEAMKPIPGGQYRPLTDEGIRKIHESALALLSEIGVEVHSRLAFETFQKRGAVCDPSKRLVKLSRSMVEDAIEKAPKKVVLCGREEKHDLYCEGKNVYLGTGGTVLNVIDLETNQKRPSLLKDVRDIARLCDALENIHFMVLPVYPNDLSPNEVDINRFHSSILNCSKHLMGGIYTLKGTLDTIRMAEMIAGSPKALRERPFISFITCVVSPLKIDDLYGDILYHIAQAGIPVAIPAEPLTGATAPVTIAGLLTGLHAETLSGVVLTQLINPGTPVLYACTATSTDLKTMGYVSGSVEMGLINAGAAAMSQYVNLPNYTTAGMSDSKIVDTQNGYEKGITNVLVALSGSNFIHDAAGLVEFASTASYKQYVIDDEIIGMVMRAVRGIEVTDETIALDAYRRIGPGGNFLADPHTVQWMRKEHFIPKLGDRQLRVNWEKSGKPCVEEKAIAIAKRILRDHKPLGLPKELNDQLRSMFPEIKP
jgi:trimethylamine--corrinoid protein Co-methyltransferase